MSLIYSHGDELKPRRVQRQGKSERAATAAPRKLSPSSVKAFTGYYGEHGKGWTYFPGNCRITKNINKIKFVAKLLNVLEIVQIPKRGHVFNKIGV